MKLFVSETKVQDAVIPIRWCLNREELKQLEERGAENPHLLIVTICEGQEVDRYLIPIDQMLAYIQFHKPGKNRILATVVWERKSNAYELRKEFLQKTSRGRHYERSVLDYGKKNFRSDFDYSYSLLERQTEIDVIVPAELFAKEPSAWEKWWVNLWFETEPRDQCQFRRRRMLAYSIQPLVVLLFVPVITIFRFLAASFFLFLGMRKVNLKPIIHPFKHDSNAVWCYAEDSVFLYNSKGELQYRLPFLFNPPVFTCLFVILLLARLIFPSFFFQILLSWWHYPLAVLAVLVGITIIVSVFVVLFSLFQSTTFWSEWREKRLEVKKKRKSEKEEKRRRAQEQLRAELEQLLVCNGDFTPKLSALPKEKQTIYLRFLDLKARVCKPFAR